MDLSNYNDFTAVDPKLPILEESEAKTTTKVERSFSKSISGYFREFSSNTSIHGFKYLAMKNGRPAEKCWWVTVLCLCIYICSSFIFMTLKKRAENPVFVSFRQPPMHIWEIPFPAITICPTTQIKPSKYNFTYFADQYAKSKLTGEGLKHFKDIHIFCRSLYHQRPELFMEGNHILNSESINFLLEQAVSVEDVIDLCITSKERTSCSQNFSPILTSSGLCFSLNMLDKSELIKNITSLPMNHINHQKTHLWDFDSNYHKTLNATFPMRTISVTDGLFLRLRSINLADEFCEKFKGYKIIIHHPGEVPALSNRYVVLAPDGHYKIWVKPDITTTSSCLEHYYPDKRGCYFSKERDLKFFKIYTEENCRLECAANFTLNKCGCVPYYLPREASTDICGLTKLKCMFEAKEEFSHMDIQLEILGEKSPTGTKLPRKCDCLPSCTSVTYDADIAVEQTSQSIMSKDSTHTMVYISFKSSNFVTMERNELFSNADFWASCGGLLGLFTGFSVVSLAEIIYFLTMKWACNLYNVTRRV